MLEDRPADVFLGKQELKQAKAGYGCSTKLNLCYTHSQCTRSLSASLLIATAAKLHTVGEQLCLLAKEFTGITCEEKAAKQLGAAYQ